MYLVSLLIKKTQGTPEKNEFKYKIQMSVRYCQLHETGKNILIQ